ncbi:MAG: autotransporter outer membrane beta-barrel domain-containing protein, partial [Verrucomicrobiota bacterium]
RGGWFADFVYTHGWTDSDLQRYATPTIALSSETEATFHAGTAEFGRLWERGRWVHGPIVGVDYVNGDQDAYQERGNESLGLDLSDAEFESLMTRIGWMIRRPFESRRAIHVPTFEAAWQKDWLRESESLDYSFQSSPVTILQNGQVAGAGQVPSGSLVREAPGEDSLSLRAALTSLFGSRDQWNLTFGYQGQFGRSNYSEHFGSVRLGRLFR